MLARLNDNNNDINSQIRLIILILKQQIFNLNSSIIDLAISVFNKQLKQLLKMENKFDNFLKNKIVFVFTSIKMQKFLNAIIINAVSCAIDLYL